MSDPRTCRSSGLFFKSVALPSLKTWVPCDKFIHFPFPTITNSNLYPDFLLDTFVDSNDISAFFLCIKIPRRQTTTEMTKKNEISVRRGEPQAIKKEFKILFFPLFKAFSKIHFKLSYPARILKSLWCFWILKSRKLYIRCVFITWSTKIFLLATFKVTNQWFTQILK